MTLRTTGPTLVLVGPSESVRASPGTHSVVTAGSATKFPLEFAASPTVAVVLTAAAGNPLDGVPKIIVAPSGHLLGIIRSAPLVPIPSVVPAIIGPGKCTVHSSTGKTGNIMSGSGHAMAPSDSASVLVILLNIVCVGGTAPLTTNSAVAVPGLELEKSLCCAGYHSTTLTHTAIKIISHTPPIVTVGNTSVSKTTNDTSYS